MPLVIGEIAWTPSEANKRQAIKEEAEAMARLEREEREEQRRRTRLYNIEGRIMPIKEREP